MKLVLLQPTLRAFETRSNIDTISSVLKTTAGKISPDDVILLPEHFSFSDDPEEYDNYIKELASVSGCTVVGGSHHRTVDGKHINYGAAVGPDGRCIGTYTKQRPYFNEQNVVTPGNHVGEFTINGRNFLILICADFWYSDLILNANTLPDVILVPALSVSRKQTPEYSASLWRHLAISRAYEFGVYVGISDWGKDSSLPKHRTCGVGGFADPTQVVPQNLFQSIAETGISVFSLDFSALEKFRDDRRMRGFFWKS